MGMNTTVFILNDMWDDYREDPRKLLYEIEIGMSRLRVKSDLGGVRRVFCHHSSSRSLIVSGGNTSDLLATASEDENVKDPLNVVLLKRAAAALGYRLVKK